ncbi:MAG: ribose-phosphate pyrophosphokinase [Candidatus Dojkabacteria bacterium]|nr:ribose-phosphate pyrophosphokinase [Candidatus Dojkabacteria bacterium]
MIPRAPLSIISCQSGLPLAKKIVKSLSKRTTRKVHLVKSQQVQFANSEIKTVVEESIRGREVYIIQDTENRTEGMSVDENLRALYTTIDACRRCDAERITAVIPSYPYARQDKQGGRDGITAARVAWELEGEMGVDHLIAIDLHNSAIQGFFRRAKIDNLRGGYVLIPYLEKVIKNPGNSVIMPTDLGGAKRANFYAQKLLTDIAFSYKRRDYRKPNCVESVEVLGDIKGKNVYIIDDMIDTGGTLIKTIEKTKKLGAKHIIALCTLALFNGSAEEKFSKLSEDGVLDLVIGTDATYHTKEFLKANKWFKELSVADYFAEVIYRINSRKSIGSILE